MSSVWTHIICRDCYAKEEPGREPVRVKNVDPESCCFCGKVTDEGIYYRYDPNKLACKGQH